MFRDPCRSQCVNVKDAAQLATVPLREKWQDRDSTPHPTHHALPSTIIRPLRPDRTPRLIDTTCFRACFCLLLLAVCLAALPADVQGCGGAYRTGERVDVADETALIIWDEAAKTEHFIRRATFVGSAYDFGFLVPTPSQPKLNEADPELFTTLGTITRPKTEYREVTGGLGIGCGAAMPGAKNETFATASGVVVLDQKRVGDLDATVLGFRRTEEKQDLQEAAAELLAWLNRNQYAVRPDLHDWLIPYVRDNWVITAFKIAGQQPGEASPTPKGTGKSETTTKPTNVGLKAAAVRMSFATDRPFFPYREPADQRDKQAGKVPRLLRVFIAAKQRMAGKLGTGTTHWPGQTVWANRLKDEERLDLLQRSGTLPRETAAGEWWLTEFEDRSTPRPGMDEVYFESSADRSAVARAPRIITTFRDPWWAGPLVIGVCIVIGVIVILIPVGLFLLIRSAWRRQLRRN
jgi:hypothetical protein